MISHTHKFIFIHIPKTGGNSISKYLADLSANRIEYRDTTPGWEGVQDINVICELNGRWSIKHNHISYFYKGYGKKVYEDYFKFTVVRNPYDRILSHYFYNKGRDNQVFDRQEFIDFINNTQQNQVDFLIAPQEERNVQTGRLPEHHRNSATKLEMDYVCKLENIDRDLDYVLSKINVKKTDLNSDSLPKLNTSNHANYKEYYKGDQQLIDLVQEVFAKDFEMLGYSKEI